MAKQYVPCPACGALGEIGSNCQFCNTTIAQKEGVIASNTRIVEKRTVTPQQYAEKISIYHNVKSLDYAYSQVSIGDQKGIINLNGDLILPLKDIGENVNFIGESPITVAYEYTITRTETEINWRHEDDPLHEKKYIDKTYTDCTILGYKNLNTLEWATANGFITDKDDPKKLHYIDLYNWTIKNEYINHKGESKTYDYAKILNLPHKLYECRFYIFHQKEGLSLCLINGESWVDETIEYLQKHKVNKNIIFLEGIEAIGKLTETNIGKLFLPIKLLNGKKLNLEIGTLDNYNHYIISDFDKPDSIWDKWLTATEEENPFEKKREKERKKREEERKEKERIKQQEEEQQRKYANKLKLKRNIAIFLGCVGIGVIYITIKNLINMPEDGNSDYHIFYIIGGGLLALIAFGFYDSTK